MKTFNVILLSSALLSGGYTTASAQERRGQVEFTDSNIVSGVISLTPGTELKIQSGSQVRALGLDRVREMQFATEREDMERAWRFKEAGQTAKEYFGDPYPVRYLNTTIMLADGEKISGHLYTTVLYVVAGEKVQKVILLAKQRGKEGETYQQLVYPKRISFADNAAATTATVKLKLSGFGAKPEVVAITRGALVKLEAKAAGSPGEFEMPSPLGREFFLAVKTGQTLSVGWPQPVDAKITALIRNALTNLEDFLDDRRVLGAIEDATNAEIYSLVFAVRKGQTHGTSDQTWRLEIYRWKLDDDGRVMLAGRDYFFRGVTAKNEPPPPVQLSGKLWNLHQTGDVWTTSDP